MNIHEFTVSKYIYISRNIKHPTYEKHSHNFLECFLVVKGYGIHIHNNFYDLLLPGSFVMINIKDEHQFLETHDLELVNISIFPNAWEDTSPLLINYTKEISQIFTRYNRHITLSGQTLYQVNALAYWAEKELRQTVYIHKETTNVLISTIISQIFVTIIRSKKNIKTCEDLNRERNLYTNQTIEHDIIDLLYNYISFDNDILITDYALTRSRTYNTFARTFKKLVGLNAKDVQNKIKLFNSRNMIIQHPEKQITQIATSSGFNDMAYFSKTFKKEFKIQPTQLLKENLRT